MKERKERAKQKQSMKERAVIYARFSPRKNADKCESIEAQIEACRAYCEKNGYEIVAELSDKAMSGGDENRPALWEAIDSLTRGAILVVHKLDRLARDVYLSELIYRETNKKGARVESVEGGINGQTPEQKMIRQILQVFAEYERKVIALRTKFAMLRLQSQGRRMSDRAPYGWARDPRDPALLVEDPFEQEIIGKIVKLYQEGYGLRKIAGGLNRLGVKPRMGREWHPSTVKNVLKRAALFGEI